MLNGLGWTSLLSWLMVTAATMSPPVSLPRLLLWLLGSCSLPCKEDTPFPCQATRVTFNPLGLPPPPYLATKHRCLVLRVVWAGRRHNDRDSNQTQTCRGQRPSHQSGMRTALGGCLETAGQPVTGILCRVGVPLAQPDHSAVVVAVRADSSLSVAAAGVQ